MSKILITGGAGFVASAMAASLASDPTNEVVIVDNLETGLMKNVPSSIHHNITFIKADVNDFRDISSVFHAWKFDFVFHYAAIVGVQRTLAQPVKVLNDVEGIKNLLNLSKNTGVKRVFYSSSSEVYGEPVHSPQNEHTTPLNSRLPYAIVKNIGEAYLKSYWNEYALEYTIFRFFNVYGPKQSEDFVISKFIKSAMKNEDITIFGDGTQSRTFCYIDDNADSCRTIFEKNLFVNDVVNIGSDIEVSILDLANSIIKVSGSSSKIVHLPPLPEGDMTRRKPDITKMKSVLNRPLITLEVGIEKVIKSIQSA